MNQTLLVSDNDQDQKNNKMNIVIRNEDNSSCTDFTASPNVIQGSGNIQILVSNNSFLDYEKIQNTTIKVIATENINSTKTAVAIVYIRIIDVNDMTPHFNSTSFKLYVKENSKSGTKISQITATDKDCSPEFRKLSYSINGGNGRFIVDIDTGYILVNCSDCRAQLDREKQNIYYMTYTAKDMDRRSDSASLIIEVTDENDNAPKFLSSIYKVVADENDAKYLNKTSPLIKIEAIDADKENTNNSLVTYFITSTSPSNLTSNFTINNSTGNMYLLTMLDYERLLDTQGEINITVEARDNGKPALNSTTIVNLHVQDKNDNTPRFNSTYYDATVSEDAVSTENNYTNVAQVFASDNDGTERNKLLNYIIIKGGSDRFTIDAGTGMVKVQLGVTLDRETTSNYTLTILAIDQGYPPRNGSTNMLIMVTDVNDSPPRFNQSEYAASVKEDANLSKAVVTCPATDLDLNHTLQYNITNIEAFDETGGNVNISVVSDYFGIHQNNGTIFVKGKLDRETAARIILMLQVTDVNAQKNLPQTAKATLTITLEDVNDNIPEFTNKSYQFSIIENARNEAILGTVKATDKDINRTITYSLTGGSTDKFKINSKTGILSKIGELDRENRTVVYVNVTATDNGIPPNCKDVNVSIVVDDFNDNAPKFGGFNRTVYLNESSENGTIVLTINASDADEGPNRNITYFIDPTINAFEINKSTGVITVRNTVDRESTPEYNLHILAKDNPVDIKEQKSNDTTVKVIVEDINDNCPNFTKVEYSARVEETKSNGTLITTVSANDKDIGENAKISYKISNSSNTTLFTIDENSGIVKVKHHLKDKIGYYNLTVIAYDHGYPQLNGTAELSIEVTDINDHKPNITNIPVGNKMSLYECASVGANVHNFSYTDGDFSDVNKYAIFKFVSQSNESSAFNLTQDGKLIVNHKLDVLKKDSYTLEIQATDTGKPPLSSEPVFITVHILDVNDHVPSFTNNITTLTLSENSTFKDSVKQVTATDDDKTSKLCYKMTKSNWTEYFNISKTDGKIYNIKKLDYERAHSMELEIKVNDCSLPDNTTYCGLNQTNIIKKNKVKEQTTIKVLITVTDTDDNPPVFKQKHLATGMRRNTEADTELELHLRNTSYINDADSPENGVLGWTFSNCRNITVSPELQNKIKHDSGDKLCDDGIKHIFCITKNGTIVNNKFFSEDLSGYFIVTVNVSDKAGFDTANVTIYLISDSQVITMSILKPKDWVAYRKDDLLSELSKILGYTAVFDSIQDHRENGVLNTQGSDLKFHIVDPKTQAVLAGKDSIELFDKQANNAEMINLQNTYSVMKVTQHNMDESTAEEGSKKLTLILVAVSIGEALIIAIVIFVALSARNKFRRKLKAAVINTPDMEMHVLEQKEAAIPGSNLYSKQNNPLLNADIKDVIHDQGVDDESSRSFEDVDLDENVVDDHTTVYDRIEEKEATMDMYNDDTYHSISSEDLLDATLNLHAMRKSKESLDKIDDDSHDVRYHSADTTAAFINESFMEDLESTEI
ncbi:cadherin-23-like [Ruditapes philippinarum]|uniref:cadherin-23-like n=1 Tax=Ruditapes philippinarum TaxID=129788 RepID=UPI00295C3573|nr:cadherin-23-like [Ruditapes philippinarum]